MMTIKKNDYQISSGNVFEDLGISNAGERLAKAELARQINNIITEKGLTQTAAAELLGIDQPKISALSTGKLSGFSLERLFRFLVILDRDIIITISPKSKSKKRANVTVYQPKTKKSRIIKRSNTLTSVAIQARKRNK